MGALAQVQIVWMPEDDFQLKNAIEGGASLESLAKGAVQFSRRFTLQEIRQRWVSILYDPVISAEVSAHVMEIERNSSNSTHKPFRFGGLKDNKCNAKKTKTLSIRDHYYAARKRIRFENRRSMEMELADGQIYASDHNYGTEVPLNYIVEDPALNQLEHKQLDAGLTDHCLSQVQGDGVATSSTGVAAQPFHAPNHEFIPENFPVDQGSLPNENLPVFGGMGILEDVNMCDANGISDPNSIFDTENLLDDFDGLLPDCGVSFDNLDFPSPLPDFATWDIIGDISAPLMPVNDNLATQSHGAREMLPLTEGGQSDISMADLDAGPVESQIAISNQGGDLRTSDSDEYLAELYDLLDDELPVVDTDDKPLNNNPFYEGLSSVLVNTPIGADLDQSSMMVKPLASVPTDLSQAMDSVNPIVSCVSGTSLADESQPSQMPVISIPSHGQSLAESNRCVTCVLNTEDPVVPNIDDIILPHVSVSVKDLLQSRNHSKTEKKNLGKPEISSKPQLCQLATGNSCNHTSFDFKAPNNLPKAGPDISVRSSSLLPDLTKGERPSRGSDHCVDNGASHLDNRLGRTSDDHAFSGLVDYNDNSAQDALTHPPPSESEEHIQDSDDEIPHYSDVEEMVLEMDLGPVDQDIELKEKVSKYQSQDAMKAIIRLEQAAHSYMHRAIARRGALAVIYGRSSKHYIKKSEVLVGRETDDSHVDIDLGAEGCAQKVSRRQAVIKLEADGKFYIKNIGKRSIYKNNLEVATGQIVRLQSGNLIEIRRMTFIFEDNPSCVRRHLRNLHRSM
ncbi:unnamed protein product [Rhodiola kirilowii]